MILQDVDSDNLEARPAYMRSGFYIKSARVGSTLDRTAAAQLRDELDGWLNPRVERGTRLRRNGQEYLVAAVGMGSKWTVVSLMDGQCHASGDPDFVRSVTLRDGFEVIS